MKFTPKDPPRRFEVRRETERWLSPLIGLVTGMLTGATGVFVIPTVPYLTSIRMDREELVQSYRDTFANPYKAAELGYVDEVILPEETRPRLCRALQMLRNKRQDVPRPTTIVIDRLGQRRISSRQAIGDSSCASSTMMCPKVQVRSAAARCADVR